MDFDVARRRDRPRAEEADRAVSFARRRPRRRFSSSSPRSSRCRSSPTSRSSAARPTVCCVTLVAVALLRGSIFGAACGFFGRPARRHGEPRDARAHLAPAHARPATGSAATARRPAATARTRRSSRSPSSRCSYQFGALLLHFMLGDPVSARRVLLDALPPKVALNLLLTAPGLRAHAAAAGRRGPAGRRDGGAAPWLAAAARVRARPLPAARPARRGAVPPHAAARAADRDPRGARARRLRRPLLPALGAAGALRAAVPAGGAGQPAPHGADRGAARADPRPQGRRSSGTSPAPPFSSGPPTCPRPGRSAWTS